MPAYGYLAGYSAPPVGAQATTSSGNAVGAISGTGSTAVILINGTTSATVTSIPVGATVIPIGGGSNSSVTTPTPSAYIGSAGRKDTAKLLCMVVGLVAAVLLV